MNSCGKCEPVRIAVDFEKLAELMYPEALTDAALYAISNRFRTSEVQMRPEEFIASTIKLIAQSNKDLSDTVISMARMATAPPPFIGCLTPRPQQKGKTDE